MGTKTKITGQCWAVLFTLATQIQCHSWEQQSPAKVILGQLPRKEKSFHALHWTAFVASTNRSLQVRCLFVRETSFLLYVRPNAACCKGNGGTHNRILLRSFHYTPTHQQKLLYSSLNTHTSHCLSACLFMDKSIIGVPCHNHCDLGLWSLLTQHRSTAGGLLDLPRLYDLQLNPSPSTALQAPTEREPLLLTQHLQQPLTHPHPGGSRCHSTAAAPSPSYKCYCGKKEKVRPPATAPCSNSDFTPMVVYF